MSKQDKNFEEFKADIPFLKRSSYSKELNIYKSEFEISANSLLHNDNNSEDEIDQPEACCILDIPNKVPIDLLSANSEDEIIFKNTNSTDVKNSSNELSTNKQTTFDDNYIDPAEFLEAANIANDPNAPSIDRAYNPNEHGFQATKIGHGPFFINIPTASYANFSTTNADLEDASMLGSEDTSSA